MSEVIVGDLNVGRDIYSGGNANIAGNATIKRNLKVEGWLDAKNIKHIVKGLFSSEDALKEEYPEPQIGWVALVGKTLPADVYICKNGAWVSTGEQSGDFEIELNNYYNKEYIDEISEGQNKINEQLLNRTAIGGTIIPCDFIGGNKLDYDSDLTGVWVIGSLLADAPKSTLGDVVKYTATEVRETIAVKIPSKYALPYRWFAIYAENGDILYEMACSNVESSYAIILQKGQTILASCDVFINPTIVSIKSMQEDIEILRSNPYKIQGYLALNGDHVSWNLDYRVTDFIPLDATTPVIIRNVYAGASSLILAFYDEDKKFISGISNASYAYIPVEEIPSGATYIRSSTSGETKEIASISNLGVLKLGYEVSEAKSKISELDTQVSEIKNKHLSLLNYGYYGLDGAMHSSENAKNTGLVKIDNYQFLKYQVKISEVAASVVFWDRDKNCLQDLSIPGTSELAGGIIDLATPQYSEVRYISLSYYDTPGLYKNYIGTLYNEKSIDRKVSKLEKVSSTTKELNILIFGDSITDCATIEIDKSTNKTTSYALKQKSGNYIGTDGSAVVYDMWPFILTQYIDCFDLRNYAKAGASFKFQERANGLERQNLSYQIDVALNDITNDNGVFPTNGEYTPDIVIFALGTNDWNPNDTFEDAMSKTILKDDGYTFDVDATLSNLDKTKFCESARYAFLKIKKVFPFALCMCVLPIQTTSRDIQQVGVNAELKKIAERYSIKVIDGASEMGIIRDLETHNGLGVCLKDGLHPNEKGQNLYARLVINAIKNNWIGFDLMN